MDINEIKDIVEENYNINIRSILKVKNSYNVKADEGEYCIKNIKYCTSLKAALAHCF